MEVAIALPLRHHTVLTKGFVAWLEDNGTGDVALGIELFFDIVNKTKAAIRDFKEGKNVVVEAKAVDKAYRDFHSNHITKLKKNNPRQRRDAIGTALGRQNPTMDTNLQPDNCRQLAT
ncbi:hypothetical protein TWF718_006358 [Orbilia javanica]|uniref:Uncharacterized protein n=1 Tax=Orbilia javanica TaxID=47235 RepID=A0AAN8N9I0_9PEZI